MRVKSLLSIFSLILAMGFNSCKKCAYCENSCSVCRDAHYQITVCSDRLSKEYYQLYLDSLKSPGLGWTCNDTVADRGDQVCASKHDYNNEIALKEMSGFTCK